VDGRGFVYATTSFSRTLSGSRNRAREKLIRFRFDGTRITERKTITGLYKVMMATSRQLRDAAKILNPKDDDGFNIEGLSFNKTKDRLLFGLRSPVIDGKAMILTMENPHGAFDNNASPKFAEKPIFLNLDKGGIRSIAYDPRLDGYLIVSRRQKKGKKFKLWLWSGKENQAPRRVRINAKVKMSKAEGISPIRIKGKEMVLVVFDTGKRPLARDGKYLVLSYDQLAIDPVAERSVKVSE